MAKWIRAITLLWGAQLIGSAATMDVQTLLQTLSTLIETDTADRAIAHKLKTIYLTERLTDPEIQWAGIEGAGPNTIQALQHLRDGSASLPVPAETGVTFDQPSPTEIRQIFERVEKYVGGYVSALTDFTCTVTTKVYAKELETSRPLPDTSIVFEAERWDWRLIKTLHQTVGYYRGREFYSKSGKQNGREPSAEAAAQAWSQGEFAATMRITFAPKSRAQFHWNHWELIHGKRVAVFSYGVDAAHSQLMIKTQLFQSRFWHEANLLSAYKGFVYADADSGAIIRLVANTTGVFPNYTFKQGNTVLNYGPVQLAGKTYLLLTNSISYVSTKRYRSLFEKVFSNYGRFNVDSRIVSTQAPAQ